MSKNRLLSWIVGIVSLVAITSCQASQPSGSSGSSASNKSGAPASSAAAPSLDIPTGAYVALGDSFSSGEGNPPFETSTQSGGDDCHRSPLGYAFEIHSLGGPVLLWNNFVACSGSQILDLINANHQYYSDGKEPPQLDRLGPKVGLVTMTMGGNDLGIDGGGLGSLISACVQKWPSGTCLQDLEPGIKDRLHALDGTRPGNINLIDLVRVYETLRHHAPNARILIAGYPHEFTGKRQDSCEKIDIADQPWMNSVIDRLNGVIQSNIDAANKATNARIEYVDPVPLFTGHGFDDVVDCEWSGQAFVNVAVTDWSNHNGFFHPNDLGQVLYAEAFMEQLRQPSPMAPGQPASACDSNEFLPVVAAAGYMSATISGPPKCAGGYALQLFTAGPGGQPAQFFFKQHWTLLEGGDAIPTIACQEIPTDVLKQLGAQCPPAANGPSAAPSSTASTTSACDSAVFLKVMQAQGASVTGTIGQPTCLDDYAKQDFTFPQGPTSNYPTFFFYRFNGPLGWRPLGGGAIGDSSSICRAMPANVRAAFTLPPGSDSGCPAE